MICESDVLGVCKIVFYFNGMNMICWEICYQIGVLYNDIYLYVFFFFGYVLYGRVIGFGGIIEMLVIIGY